jgi:hypothetical protein
MMGHFVGHDVRNKQLKETIQVIITVAAEQRTEEEGLQLAGGTAQIGYRQVDMSIL